jgi:hypothetical protein
MTTNPPTNHSWVNNEKPNFRDMNNYLYWPLMWALNPPMVRLRKTGTQTIPNNVSTAISWDFIEVENYDFWNASQPTRLTPSVPGWYVGTCGYSFAANALSGRELNVIKNGSSTDRVLKVNHDAFTDSSLPLISRGHVFMEKFNGSTDYLTIEVLQATGSGLDLYTGGGVASQPDVVLRWLAPL